MSGAVDRIRWASGVCVLTLADKMQAQDTGIGSAKVLAAARYSVVTVDAFIYRMLQS